MPPSDHDSNENLAQTAAYSATALQNRPVTAEKAPPCLVLVIGPAPYIGRQWTLGPNEQTLGRASSASIQIEENSLSKAHASFKLSGDRVFITDLGATNKTLVNGQTLEPKSPRVLNNNDQIRAGGLVFKFLQKGILSETVEKARMQGELEQAREVQSSLLPTQPQALYGMVQIGGRYRTASECGGDWWWHWTTGRKAFAIIGDATGHGAGAALITSAARSAVTTMEEDPNLTLEKVFSTLTRAINRCGHGVVTMSAFLVEVNLDTATVKYINASHLPAVVLDQNPQNVTWKELKFLEGAKSNSLGATPSEAIVETFSADVGMRLVLLTDGLTERKSQNGDMLLERIFYKNLIQVHAQFTNDQQNFLDTLIAKSDELAQYSPQDDDITVVAIDFINKYPKKL